MGLAPIPYGWVAEGHPSRRDRILTAWIRHHVRAKHRFEAWRKADQVPEPYRSDLMCIHRYEGSMIALNPAGPYYGGWQEDATFESEYGADFMREHGGRDARYWTPHEQLVSAYRAVVGWMNPILHEHFDARGFGPWPSTRLMCGL